MEAMSEAKSALTERSEGRIREERSDERHAAKPHSMSRSDILFTPLFKAATKKKMEPEGRPFLDPPFPKKVGRGVWGEDLPTVTTN